LLYGSNRSPKLSKGIVCPSQLSRKRHDLCFGGYFLLHGSSPLALIHFLAVAADINRWAAGGADVESAATVTTLLSQLK